MEVTVLLPMGWMDDCVDLGEHSMRHQQGVFAETWHAFDWTDGLAALTWRSRLLLAVVAVCLTQLTCAGGLAAELQPKQLAGLRWRELGPSATGGRIVDIEAVPDDVATIYAAAASGGLWKTANNGTTWQCIFENEGTLSIGDIALDPKNPNVLWVGTGEANNQRSALWGDGIYKSTDGGKTWKNMGLPDTHHIGRIVVHPRNPDTVYVAALGHLYTFNEQRGLFKTTDGGRNWKKVLYVSPKVGVVDVVLDPINPDIVYAATYERLRRAWDFDGAGPGSAIYKSTDGGRSWSKLGGGLPSGEIGRIGLAIFPENPSILYASVSNQNLAPSDAAAKDTDAAKGNEDSKKNDKAKGFRTPFGFGVGFSDGGCRVVAVDRGGAAARAGLRIDDVVEEIGGGSVSDELSLMGVLSKIKPGDRVTMEVRREQQQLALAVTLPAPEPRQIGGEIYRTDDGGETWKKQNEKPIGGRPAYYYGQIRIDPKDEKRLYVLSVPLYVSEDGGKKWTSDAASSVHVDHHAMWVNPHDPRHVQLGNDGGFHISYDRAKTWDYVFNLPLAQFYAVGFDMQQPYHVYGGLQDNGSFGGPSRSRNRAGIGRFQWYRVGGGDGFYVQVDPNDHNRIISESQFGHINRLDRRTGQRKSIRPPQSDPAGPPDRYNWMSPILRSSHDPRTIFFAGNRLFKSFNRGDDWIVISPDLTTADPQRIAGNVPHCTITTVAQSPIDAKRLLVGTDDGKVQWSNDGGVTWTDVSGRFPIKPANWWVTRVELSRHAADTAYVSFSAFREDDFRPFVFVTKDRGESWRPLMGNLPTGPVKPAGPINVVKEDPRAGNVLYVGTDFGVFVSINGGRRWTALAAGLPRVSVHDLVVHARDRDLIVGTHGRGIFVINVAPLQELNAEILQKPVHLFAVPKAVAWRSVSTQAISGDRRLMSPNPPYGAVISYFLKDKTDKKRISLRVVDQSDETIRALQPKTAAGINCVAWNLRGGRFRNSDSSEKWPTYTAVLKVDEEEFRQPIVVDPDPLGE